MKSRQRYRAGPSQPSAFFGRAVCGIRELMKRRLPLPASSSSSPTRKRTHPSSTTQTCSSSCQCQPVRPKGSTPSSLRQRASGKSAPPCSVVSRPLSTRGGKAAAMTGIVNYGAFTTAGILLNLIPGVDTLYILTRSCTGGRRIGVASALGISTGILFHLTLVSLGLAAVLASAPSAVFALKCLGAGYLFYLGVKAFRDGGSALGGARPPGESPAVLARRRAHQRAQSQGGPLFPRFPARLRRARGGIEPRSFSAARTLVSRDEHGLERDPRRARGEPAAGPDPQPQGPAPRGPRLRAHLLAAGARGARDPPVLRKKGSGEE